MKTNGEASTGEEGTGKQPMKNQTRDFRPTEGTGRTCDARRGNKVSGCGTMERKNNGDEDNSKPRKTPPWRRSGRGRPRSEGRPSPPRNTPPRSPGIPHRIWVDPHFTFPNAWSGTPPAERQTVTSVTTEVFGIKTRRRFDDHNETRTTTARDEMRPANWDDQVSLPSAAQRRSRLRAEMKEITNVLAERAGEGEPERTLQDNRPSDQVGRPHQGGIVDEIKVNKITHAQLRTCLEEMGYLAKKLTKRVDRLTGATVCADGIRPDLSRSNSSSSSGSCNEERLASAEKMIERMSFDHAQELNDLTGQMADQVEQANEKQDKLRRALREMEERLILAQSEETGRAERLYQAERKAEELRAQLEEKKAKETEQNARHAHHVRELRSEIRTHISERVLQAETIEQLEHSISVREAMVEKIQKELQKLSISDRNQRNDTPNLRKLTAAEAEELTSPPVEEGPRRTEETEARANRNRLEDQEMLTASVAAWREKLARPDQERNTKQRDENLREFRDLDEQIDGVLKTLTKAEETAAGRNAGIQSHPETAPDPETTIAPSTDDQTTTEETAVELAEVTDGAYTDAADGEDDEDPDDSEVKMD